jgi:hypothetical protein
VNPPAIFFRKALMDSNPLPTMSGGGVSKSGQLFRCRPT